MLPRALQDELTMHLTRSGRLNVSLRDVLAKGTVASVANRRFNACVARTPRDGGRYDFTLSDAWAERMLAQSPAFTKLEAEIPKQDEDTGYALLRTWHLMVVAPGASAQPWHVDQAGNDLYCTLLVPLTRDPPGSGTEFKDEGVRNDYGAWMWFKGTREHRGTAHPADAPMRAFMYAAVRRGIDYND